jgi:hypothetical protein
MQVDRGAVLRLPALSIVEGADTPALPAVEYSVRSYGRDSAMSRQLATSQSENPMPRPPAEKVEQ